MKKKFAYLGVILVIVGFIVALVGSMTRENSILVLRDENAPPKTWSYSLRYEKGQKLGLGLSTGDNWMAYEVSDEFKAGGEYISYLPVVVTITVPSAAPSENVTLEIEYSPIPGSTAPIPPLDIFIVKVLHKSGILKMDTSVENWTSGNNVFTSEYLNDNKIQNGIGIVQYTGWYYVTVSSVGLQSPPNKIVLYKYNVEIVRDYWYLIPVGGAIAVVGVILAVLGIKSVEKRARIETLRRTAKS